MKKDVLDPDVDRQMHEVQVLEIIPASRYIYLKVKEGGREFWIATQKEEVKAGESYLYNEAVQKTAFESREHQRIFDTLYLVTTLIPKEHGSKMHGFKTSALEEEEVKTIKESIQAQDDGAAIFVGKIRIVDLVKDPEKYEGKKIELSGTCTKVNPQIMGRNWIHLKDGSKDDYDLVITSNEMFEKGDEISLRGIVRLNVDFGSGYAYPILIENGVLVE
jgi:hypothetical protein